MPEIRGKQKTDLIISAVLSLAVLLVLMLYAGYLKQLPKAGTGEFRLPVFGTSDIHGSLVGEMEEPHKYMLAFIADKVEDARKTDSGFDTDRTVLIDGGDIYQGKMVSNTVKGESLSAAFDAMEYDAVAVGNHEFDWSVDTVIDDDSTMRDYTEDGEFHKNKIPVICCNLFKDGQKVDFARDYVILNKTAYDESGSSLDVKIGVIGFAEDYSSGISEAAFKDLGYTIIEDYDDVNRIAGELKHKECCDAVILLAHGAADRIAEALGDSTEVDLVYGGHIHKNKNDKTEWGLRYLSPSGNGYAYMYSELVFENDGRGGARISEGADDRAEYVRTAEDEDLLYDKTENAQELDQGIVKLTNEYLDIVSKQLSEEIGYVTVSLVRDKMEGCDRRTTPAHNFINDAMRRAADADISFINMGGVRADLRIGNGSDRRPVTLMDIYSMLPFDDTMYVYEITYEELIDVFNYSLDNKAWGVLTSMTGIDCYFMIDPTDDGSSGEKYLRRILSALVKDGEVIWKDGRWAEGWKDRKVRIVTSEFSATTNRNKGGMDNPLCGYNGTDRLVSNDTVLREAVIKALKDEAAENDGHLNVDTDTHFIFREYEGI